jgi:hypothetical protein
VTKGIMSKERVLGIGEVYCPGIEDFQYPMIILMLIGSKCCPLSWAKVMLAGLPLVVVVGVVVFVWMVLDVASKIVNMVGVFIVVVFGRVAWLVCGV